MRCRFSISRRVADEHKNLNPGHKKMTLGLKTVTKGHKKVTLGHKIKGDPRAKIFDPGAQKGAPGWQV